MQVLENVFGIVIKYKITIILKKQSIKIIFFINISITYFSERKVFNLNCYIYIIVKASR